MANHPYEKPNQCLSTSLIQARRRIVDKDPTKLPEGYQPGNLDVKSGRGKGVWGHKGNLEFRKAIFGNMERYINANTKDEITSIVACVVASLRDRGMYFVDYDEDDGWFDIGNKRAKQKTRTAFRDYKKSYETLKSRNKINKQGKMQPSNAGKKASASRF